MSRVAELDQLMQSWDKQQAAYITNREERFAIMVDVISHHCASQGLPESGAGLTVLDLACGPGSLASRLLNAFPEVRVIGVDYDPVLLTLATEWLSERHGNRFTAIDADLASLEWTRALPEGPIHVVVSSTALHWLEPGQLVAVYAALGDALPSDGVFMNADHLRYNPRTQPFQSALAAADDARTQLEAHSSGVPNWDEWWAEAVQQPILGRHSEERTRRFADRPPTPHAPLELHLQALTTAGFSETGTIWRHYDDVVVFARR